MDFVNIFISSVLGGAVGAVVYCAVHNYGLDRRMAEVEQGLMKLRQGMYGQRGQAQQAETSERLQTVIAEGLLAIQQGKPPQEVIKELAVRNPDVAMEVIKKLGLKL